MVDPDRAGAWLAQAGRRAGAWQRRRARALAAYLTDRILRVLARWRHFAVPLVWLAALILALPLFGLGSHLTRRIAVERQLHTAPVPETADVAGAADEAGLFNEPVESEYVEHVVVPPPGQLDGSLVASTGSAEADVYAGARADVTGSDPAEVVAYLTWFGMVVGLVGFAQLRRLLGRRYRERWLPAWRQLDRWLDERLA